MLFQKCFWVSEGKLSLIFHLRIYCHPFSSAQRAQGHVVEKTQPFRGLTICSSGSLSLFWEANLLNYVETQLNVWGFLGLRLSKDLKRDGDLRWEEFWGSPPPPQTSPVPSAKATSFSSLQTFPSTWRLSPRTGLSTVSRSPLPLPATSSIHLMWDSASSRKKGYRLGKSYIQSQIPDKEQLLGPGLFWIRRVICF